MNRGHSWRGKYGSLRAANQPVPAWIVDGLPDREQGLPPAKPARAGLRRKKTRLRSNRPKNRELTKRREKRSTRWPAHSISTPGQSERGNWSAAWVTQRDDRGTHCSERTGQTASLRTMKTWPDELALPQMSVAVTTSR